MAEGHKTELKNPEETIRHLVLWIGCLTPKFHSSYALWLAVFELQDILRPNDVKTRQSVAVQREGGIPVGNKILHPYQNP